MIPRLLLCLLLLCPGLLSAATYHVDKTGSDAVSCANADYAPDATQAKLTVAAGIACATTAGDTVIIHPGTYVESVSTGVSGSSGSLITIKGSGAAILQGNFLVDNDYISVEDLRIDQQSINVQAGADHVQLLNITVTNAPSHGIVLDGSGGAIDAILISGCTVTGSGAGGTGSGIRGGPDNNTIQKTNITIEGCLLHGNTEDGINIANTDGLVIRNSTIYNNGEEGIDVKQNSNNTRIEANLVYDNHNAGIFINTNGSSSAPPTVGGTLLNIVGNTVYGSGTVAGDAQIRLNSKAPEAGTDRSVIANNLCIGSTVATTDCISIFRCSQLDIFYNTIVNATRWGIIGRCYRDGVIMNNIITGPDRAFSAETSGNPCTGYTNGLITEDYNDLITTGSSLIRWTTGTAYATLSAYQAATGQGAHSLSVDPQFVVAP